MKIFDLLQHALICPTCGKTRLLKAAAFRGHGTGQHGQAHFNAQTETLDPAQHCTCHTVIAAQPNVYIDAQGRECLVSTGISGQFSDSPITFAAYRRKPGKQSHHRIVSKYLPIRSSQTDAQADLDAYAKKHHWTAQGA
jgi:hypothetical protein